MFTHFFEQKPRWQTVVLVYTVALWSSSALLAQDTEEEQAIDQRSSTQDDAENRSDDENVVVYPDRADEPEEVRGDNSIPAQPASPAEKEALKRRAGEKIAGTPRGRAVVLGMHIQEGNAERAKVVDVAPSSSAYHAGIRKGDEIVTFGKFKATTYRDWIDGMRRVTRDVPDGDVLPVELMRGMERVVAEVRVPVSRVALRPQPDELAPNQVTIAPGQQGPPSEPGQAPMPLASGGGDDVLIANAFGSDFSGAEAGPTEGAIAEIIRLRGDGETSETGNALGRESNTQAEASGASQRNEVIAQAQGNPSSAGAQIGLAGFRDGANGMFVMMDVGGLPPGDYLVGIGDPSIMQAGVAPAANTPRGASQDPAGTSPEESEPGGGPAATPSGQPSGTETPQRGLDASSSQSGVRRTVLAQVTDVPATGQSQQTANPATGASEPLGTPPTGAVREPGATPTGVPRSVPADVAQGGTAPSLQIGLLTVDQNGTGRLQQTVEAARVQDILGQAIAIYPHNANSPAFPGANDPITDQPASREDPKASAGLTQPQATVGTTANIGNAPIAAGVIRPMSQQSPSSSGDGLPAPNSPDAGNAAPMPPSGVPQNTAVPASPEQPTR